MERGLRSEFRLDLGQRATAHVAFEEYGSISEGFMVDENTAYGMSKK